MHLMVVTSEDREIIVFFTSFVTICQITAAHLYAKQKNFLSLSNDASVKKNWKLGILVGFFLVKAYIYIKANSSSISNSEQAFFEISNTLCREFVR